MNESNDKTKGIHIKVMGIDLGLYIHEVGDKFFGGQGWLFWAIRLEGPSRDGRAFCGPSYSTVQLLRSR